MDALVGWISLVGLVYLIIFPHELAHALMAKVVGLQVKRFEMGVPGIIRFRTLGIDFVLGPLPLRGLLDTEEEMEDVRNWKLFLLAGAGPLASIILAMGLFLLVYWPYELRQLTIPAVNHLAEGLVLAMRNHDSILGFLAWELGVLPGLSKLTAFLWLSPAIGLSAGVGNLVPFAPLDGGWMAIAAIDFVTGRRIKISKKRVSSVLRLFSALGILFLVYDLILTQILW